MRWGWSALRQLTLNRRLAKAEQSCEAAEAESNRLRAECERLERELERGERERLRLARVEAEAEEEKRLVEAMLSRSRTARRVC